MNMEPVYEVRVGVLPVRQRELDRQHRNQPIPRLPDGVARWEKLEDAVSFFGWCIRQYPDQEVHIVGSLQRVRAARAKRAGEIEDEAAAAGRRAELDAQRDAEHDATMVARENGARRPPASLIREMDRRNSK